jgi:signal transduction histidine kinase
MTSSTPNTLTSAMTEVLRLLRLSLLLRLIPAAGAVIRFMVVGAPSPLVWVLPLIPGLFTLAQLVYVSGAIRRGESRIGMVRRVLFVSMLVYAVENLIVAAFLTVRGTDLGALLPNGGGNDGDPGASFGASLFFTLIPAMLGAWVDGRRRFLIWIALAVVVNIVVTLSFIAANGAWSQITTDPSRLAVFIAQAVIFTVVCFFVASLADRQREEHAELEQANVQLREQAHVREQLAAGRERMAISRDLHDTVAHSLAALSVQLNAVESTLSDLAKAREQLAIAKGLVRDGLSDTRQAVAGLRMDAVRDLGLIAALRKHIESVNRRGRIDAQFNSDTDTAMLPLPDATADAFFRIAQEALNNAEKHASASRVRVSLHHRAECLELSVRDDGIGFDQSVLDADRFGLRGMRERAELIGAHLTVKSSPGNGTTVLVSLERPVPGSTL